MRLLERLPKETARDYAIRVLRENIVKTYLEPGCMVSENELASEMGVSRTPVREALIELSRTGVVEIFPQHGSMVSKIDYDKVEEASFTRRVLEIAVVREACLTFDESGIKKLDDNLMLQDLYLDKGDVDKLLGLDDEFHRLLFQVCRKMLSYELMTGLMDHFDRVRHLSLVVIKHMRIVEDHHAILQGIKTRNPDAAAEAMDSHLKRYKIDIVAIRDQFPHYFAS